MCFAKDDYEIKYLLRLTTVGTFEFADKKEWQIVKMKSKRRWLALLMAFVMLTSSLPVAAFAEGHTHTTECYVTEGDLLCTIPESDGHAHTSECVCLGGEYVCGLDGTEDHEHTSDCVCGGGISVAW